VTASQRLRLVWLTLFVCTAAGAGVYLLQIVGFNVVSTTDYYRVRAAVPTAVTLAQYADVRQAGVKIGKVSKLERGPGQTSVLTLRLEPEHGPIYRDATLLVRAKSIAEESYVELDPGHPRAGAVAENGVLPAERALEATQNDDVFSIFDRLRRRDLRRALRGLGPGLGSGRGLNRTFESTRGFSEDATPFARILSDERRHVAGLVDSFGRVTRALGERREGIRTFTRRAKVIAESVASRDRRLRETLEALPPFLAQSRRTALRLREFGPRATPVMRDLRLATQDLVPATRDLRPAAAASRELVRELDRFSRVALPAMRRLRPFAGAAIRFVPPFSAFLRELNPLARYLDPYWREVTTWFANQGAHTASRDELGHTARVLLPISRSNFPGTVPPELEKFVEDLDALDTRGSNAYPEPGRAGDPSGPFEGSYPRLEREGPYGR
jgi:phospholipid/cholesterol/gamma-HCH transport system substrate-binding protein